jgi:hypothetical protein
MERESLSALDVEKGLWCPLWTGSLAEILLSG